MRIVAAANRRLLLSQASRVEADEYNALLTRGFLFALSGSRKEMKGSALRYCVLRY